MQEEKVGKCLLLYTLWGWANINMGLEVNIAVSCSIVVDGVVGHTLGFLILVLDITFNPISCRKKKRTDAPEACPLPFAL